MDWKSRLEKNPFFVVIGACVATGGVVAGVLGYYSSQRVEIAKGQCDSQVMELKTQLASITRSIGHQEYLDVRNIVIPRDRISPVPNSQYFDDAGFYASPATGDWEYVKTSETALGQSLVEEDIGRLQVFQAVGSLAPIHVWKTKKTLRVKGGPGFKNLYPYVYVEKVPVEILKKAVGSMVAQGGSPFSVAKAGEGASTGGRTATLETFFRGDIAGKLLTGLLNSLIITEDVLPSELLNVQKVQNVVYLAVRYTMTDVEVEKIAHSHYYIYSEMVIISDGPNATIVKTFIPSADPSGNVESSQYISAWLSALRVLVG